MNPEAKQKIREFMRKKKTTHGDSKTEFYRYWMSFKHRHSKDMPESWMDFAKFKEDTNPPTPYTSMLRIDKTKPFSKENIYWSEVVEGSKLTEFTKILKYGNLKMTQNQWAKRLGVHSSAINQGIAKHGSLTGYIKDRKRRGKM